MSIASRIEAIEQHLTDDYNVLEVAGADLTNVDKNILNLKSTWQERLLYFMNNGTDVVWNNWDKVIGEGTTLTLNNTLEGKMKINLKGNTYQYSTSGINLFDNSNSIWVGASVGKVNYDENNDTFTFHRDSGGDYLVGKGKFNLKANTPYSIYINVVNNTMTNTMRTGGANLSLPISIPSGATGKYVFSGTSNSDLSLNYDLWLYCPNTHGTFEAQLMLVEGTYTLETIPSYEPYTNGASPNPDYPQDIHVVSGDNSIVVCGKNLFDESYYNNYNLYTPIIYYYAYIEMPDSFKTKFYGNMSLKGTAQDLLFGFSTTNNGVPSVQRMLNAGNINSNIEYDFTNATNVYLIIGNGTGITLATDIPRIFENYNIMVSTTSNEPYEAYKGASYPITLPEGMFLGWIPNTDYRDIIFQAKTGDTYYDSLDSTTKESLTYGKWYLNKQIGKVVLDGTNNPISSVSSSSGGVYYAILTKSIDTFLNVPPMSNRYKGGNPGVVAGRIYIATAKNLVMCDTGTSLTTKALWNTWLETNNVVIYYVLSTPTYTEITDSTLLSQLEAIKRSYLGQTNISQNNTDLPFIINATALKEIE